MERMTREMDKQIQAMMNEECSGLWFENELTDEMLGRVCARCPYAGERCRNGLCYGCSCWEEQMGEDV